MGLRFGREQWKQVVGELESSKLSHKEFAAQKGISLGTLEFWLYKFRRESRQELGPTLLPVQVVSSTALTARQPKGDAMLEAVLSSGATLRFPVGTDANYLRELLSALS